MEGDEGKEREEKETNGGAEKKRSEGER